MTDPDTPPPGTAAAGPDTPAAAAKVPLAAAFRTSPRSSRALVPVAAGLRRDLVFWSIPWSLISRDRLPHAGIGNQLARDRVRLLASFASIPRLMVIEPLPFLQPCVGVHLGIAKMLAQPSVNQRLGIAKMLAQPSVDLHLGIAKMAASWIWACWDFSASSPCPRGKSSATRLPCSA